MDMPIDRRTVTDGFITEKSNEGGSLWIPLNESGCYSWRGNRSEIRFPSSEEKLGRLVLRSTRDYGRRSRHSIRGNVSRRLATLAGAILVSTFSSLVCAQDSTDADLAAAIGAAETPHLEQIAERFSGDRELLSEPAPSSGDVPEMQQVDGLIFPGPFFNDDPLPGFDLGDTTLPDPMQSEEEQLVPEYPRNVPRAGAARSDGEALESELPDGVLPTRPTNTVPVRYQEARRRTAINQAISTGEAFLGNLGSLRGSLNSPFLITTRRKRTTVRSKAIDFRPFASIGVVGGDFNGSDGGDDGEPVGGFLQAGFTADFLRGRRFSGAIDYTFGISTPTASSQGGNGGRGGGGSGGKGLRIDQQLLLDTTFSFPQITKVQFGFGLNYAFLSGVSRDVGGAAERTLATASFTASYDYSKKTSIDLALSTPIRAFSNETSSEGLTTSIFVNNQITQKTRVSLGVAVGTLRIENASTQWFEQVLFETRYLSSEHLSFEGTVGLEFRQGGGDDVSPIFGLGVGWKPRLGTEISFAAESRVFNSATEAGTNYRTTSFDFTVRQRIGYRLSAALSLGYEHATYEGGSGSRDQGRTDNLIESSVGFDLPITRHWTWTLSFSAGKNFSNVQPFDFYQAVLQTSYQF